MFPSYLLPLPLTSPIYLHQLLCHEFVGEAGLNDEVATGGSLAKGKGFSEQLCQFLRLPTLCHITTGEQFYPSIFYLFFPLRSYL